MAYYVSMAVMTSKRVTYENGNANIAVGVDCVGREYSKSNNRDNDQAEQERTVLVPHRGNETQLRWVKGEVFWEREPCLEEAAFTACQLRIGLYTTIDGVEYALESVRWPAGKTW